MVASNNLRSGPDGVVTLQLLQLDPADHKQHTRFWYLHEWQEFKRTEQDQIQLNGLAKAVGNLAHLQDGKGDYPDPTTSSAIRDSARAIFRQFVHDGNPPTTWGTALPAQRDRFKLEMETCHTILRYCLDGWKAALTASVLYPSFKLSEKRKLEGQLEMLPKWLTNVKDRTNDTEEAPEPTVDSPGDITSQSRKRKTQPKAVVAEPSRAQKRRGALSITDPLSVISFCDETCTYNSAQSCSSPKYDYSWSFRTSKGRCHGGHRKPDYRTCIH